MIADDFFLIRRYDMDGEAAERLQQIGYARPHGGGVLADAAGRQHYLDYGDWRSFFEACGDDPVIEEIDRLLDLLDDSLTVVLLTGRPRRVAPHTLGWLDRYKVRWDLLIMREYGDYSGVDYFKIGRAHV